MNTSVLAHLAERFKVPHPETLVTEALCFVLNRHPAARAAMVALLSSDAVPQEVRGRVEFSSEVAGADGGGGRVDIAGRAGSRTWMSIEGKFGAPLTDKQPVAYLRALEVGGSTLLVCPAPRIPDLRAALAARTAAAGLSVAGEPWRAEPSGVEWLALGGGRRMGITAWPRLLAVLGDAAPGGRELESDLYQLGGIITKFEDELVGWTAQELTAGGVGGTFAKALHTTRVLCRIVGAELEAPYAPRWHAPGKNAVLPSTELWDWYGQEFCGAWSGLSVCMEPTSYWGLEGCRSPLRVGFRTAAAQLSHDRLYQVYLAMHRAADRLLDRHQPDLPALPATDRADRDATWWLLPFPLRPTIAGAEAAADLRATVQMLLAPLRDEVARTGSARCAPGGVVPQQGAEVPVPTD
ncbi:hypothetical protein [Streptomyces sp. NBC_00083]|uniref:hypothetical protein n=1 Tax=Streptomyces sp. NBC_00083 TaxID=2975647 RepID=UPI00224EAF5D|nr:hypothetical protein [Streptomyces sp. NBC_00083]MCX5384807.1 hypothetical protein [Streptomyces sp. NBC_00083]